MRCHLLLPCCFYLLLLEDHTRYSYSHLGMGVPSVLAPHAVAAVVDVPPLVALVLDPIAIVVLEDADPIRRLFTKTSFELQ